jgi:hypothetical protein
LGRNKRRGLLTILASSAELGSTRQTSFLCMHDTTNLIRNAEELKRDPHPLDKRTKAACEERDVHVFAAAAVRDDSLERGTSAFLMVVFAAICVGGHGGRRERIDLGNEQSVTCINTASWMTVPLVDDCIGV